VFAEEEAKKPGHNLFTDNWFAVNSLSAVHRQHPKATSNDDF